MGTSLTPAPAAASPAAGSEEARGGGPCSREAALAPGTEALPGVMGVLRLTAEEARLGGGAAKPGMGKADSMMSGGS